VEHGRNSHPRAHVGDLKPIGIIGGVRMTKPEVSLPLFASRDGAGTAALCVSAAGVLALLFVVVDGQAPGHGIVIVPGADGFKNGAALPSWLNESYIVWRRSASGKDKVVFDVWCEMFAKFARSYNPEMAKTLSMDGAKVHSSPKDLLILLWSNVHVIAEPSQMARSGQALENSSAFGRYQLKVQSRIRETSFERRDDGRPFSTPELIRSIAGAAHEAHRVSALSTAFRGAVFWPLDPNAVSREGLSKRADAPIGSVDLELLTRQLLPFVREDIECPRVVNGTLSTAGRGIVLTAFDVLTALKGVAAAKKARKAAKEAVKRAREAKSEEKKGFCC